MHTYAITIYYTNTTKYECITIHTLTTDGLLKLIHDIDLSNSSWGRAFHQNIHLERKCLKDNLKWWMAVE